jgi:hypothetical protein
VRLKVVLLGSLACLLIISAAVGGLVAYAAWRTPARAYAQDFDRNLAMSEPRLWPAIQADPALRQELLEKSGAAYLRGGWPAATHVFYGIIRAELEAYGGDAQTLACHVAWQNIFRALLDHPKACRLVQTYGTDGVPDGLAKAEIARMNQVCDEATLDGEQRRNLPNPPRSSSEAEYRTVWNSTLTSPKPLSDDEKRALTQPGKPDEAAWCRGTVDQGDNLTAQPREIAARILRYQFGGAETGAVELDQPAPPAGPVAAPASLTCAATGTRFTLSMAGRDGRPITWTSTGAHGWDCALQSSASGRRGVFTDLGGDTGNPLKLLWPLSIGKTANCGCEGEQSGVFKIVSLDRYWLPFGWVQAYAIEEDISSWDGAPLYKITKYWSPELGFVIGQHTEVDHGDWPDNVAPDWQVVAMDRQ